MRGLARSDLALHATAGRAWSIALRVDFSF
jgi:hypothetical protein